MWTKIFLGILCAGAVTGVAHADIDDEKPWEWERYESYMLRNKQENGACDAIAEDIKAPKLQCAFDKKAWDDHLKKEVKIERLRKRNHQQPSNCDGGGFQAFRSTSSNGSFPTGDGAEAVAEEFRKQVSVLSCTFDDTDKDPWLTFDAAKHTLAIHLTRKESWNSLWIAPAMREGELKKRFPQFDKYFSKRE